MSVYETQPTVEVNSTVELPEDVADEIQRALDREDTDANAVDLAFDRLDRTTEFVVNGQPLAEVVDAE